MMGWRFWAELLIRSGILLIVYEALWRFGRRMSAAQRHRTGVFAFGLLALLPLLSAVLPVIPIGELFGGRAVVTVETGPFATAVSPVSRGAGAEIDWMLLAWSTGAAIGFAWLAMGRIGIWRLVRRAERLDDARILELLPEVKRALGLRRGPEILILDRPMIPVTFGILRPKILLPADCKGWTLSRWRMVLLHELAHVKRRDVAAQLFANAVCALWWFQPLVWRARRKLRRESERACDAQVISAGLRPSEYAAELLAIARGARYGVPSCAAIGMASEHLEARLRAVLRRDTAAPSRANGFTAALMLIVFGMAASAIDLGGSTMKRTILSGLLASASLSAATIGGTVLDPSGAAIPNANILLINPQNSAQQQTMTSAADGKFSFDGLAAGQYILRVEKPGFANLFREYTVKDDTNVARALVMQIGRIEQALTVQATGKAASTNEAPMKPIRIGGEVEASNLVTKVNPVYPPSARAAGVQGTVTIEATISKNGTPLELTVLSSPSDELSQSALEAVRQWRYRPTLLNGEPVEVITDIRVSFQLVP